MASRRMDVFGGLFEDGGGAEARGYLLGLWEQDREAFGELVCEAAGRAPKYRGMVESICDAAVRIGDDAVREMIEEALLSRCSAREVTNRLAVTAMLMGSVKIKGRFRKAFERTFACGLDNPAYNDLEAVHCLEIIAFAQMTEFADAVEAFLSRKQEQRHRRSKPVQMDAARENKLARRDCAGMKMAQAVRGSFTGGPGALREYLNAVDDGEGRAFETLFCLACWKDRGDLEFFADYYRRHDDVRLKSICVEAMVYIGPEEETGRFVCREVRGFDLEALLSKRSLDWGFLYVERQPAVFRMLLEVCLHLRSLRPDLAETLQTLTKARDPWTAAVASGILVQHGVVPMAALRSGMLEILPFASSPAGLLSLRPGM